MKKTDTVDNQPLTASQVVYQFLKENKISPKIEVIEKLNTWDGSSGFLLNDKPLLKVTFEYTKEI